MLIKKKDWKPLFWTILFPEPCMYIYMYFYDTEILIHKLCTLLLIVVQFSIYRTIMLLIYIRSHYIMGNYVYFKKSK